MIIFGINVPLPEILALLIIMFAVFLYIILRNIQRVSTMSLQSRNELMELARMTEEEREEIVGVAQEEAAEMQAKVGSGELVHKPRITIGSISKCV